MRVFLAIIVVALMTDAAIAQRMGKGRRNQQDAPQAQDLAKKKAADEAFKRASKTIPESTEKPDPWKGLR
jgi:hypothetical protein